MGDENKTVNYEIRSDPGPFESGMDKVANSAKKTAKEIQDSFKSIESSMQQVTAAFKSVTAVLGTLTAIMAGGKAFKEVIDASNAWTGEAKKLSMQLGVTTERASVMMVAMRHLGMDSESMTLAAGKMAKQIATNGAAFEKLGVQVKDANGQYRPTLDIMGEVNSKLKEIKNPIEQNIAGTEVYGRSWNDVRGTLKLTSEEIKAAEQKTRDLGLVVGDEAVSQTKKYKESMNDMKLVMTSIEIQLGAAVMPAFVALGSWLSGVGPVVAKASGLAIESLGNIMHTLGETVMAVWDVVADGFSQIGALISAVMGTDAPGAMEIFDNSLKVIEIAFVGFKIAVQIALEAVMAIVDIVIAKWIRLAMVAERVLHLDFAGAKKAWQEGTKNIEDVQQQHMDKLVKIAADGREKIDAIAMRGPKKEAPIKDKTIEGGPTYDFGKDKDAKEKSRFKEWEAKLGADKDGYAKEQAIAGTAREYSLSQERDYWKRLLDNTRMTTEERAQVEKKYYAVKAQIRKEEFDQQIAGEKASMENYKHNHLAREEIAQQIYKQNVARFGEESKEAKAAYGEILKEQRAYAEQTLATAKVLAEASRNAALAEVDADEAEAAFKVQTYAQTHAQLLDQQEQFEAKRYQIKMQSLIEQEAMMRGPDEDPTALVQIHAQIEAMESQHQARLAQIRRQQYLEQNKNTLAMVGTLQSGMQQIIAGTLNGTIRTSNIMRSMLQMVAGAVVDMLAKTAAQWVMDAITKKAIGSVSALSQITQNAGVAGSAAFAATAAIPVIGPGLAPEAAAAAFAGAMSFAPSASAAGGYDIPAGLNPIVQTHAREMILPAKHADVIRSLADGGGTSGVGHVVNYHDHSGKLTDSDIRRKAKVIADVLKDQMRKQ